MAEITAESPEGAGKERQSSETLSLECHEMGRLSSSTSASKVSEAAPQAQSQEGHCHDNIVQTETLTLPPEKEVENEEKNDALPPKRSRRQWIVLVTLLLGNLLAGSSISLQSPFFPQEAESKGATPTQYGLVFGIYELAVLTAAPFVAKLLSRVSPKFMLVGGTFLLGGACVLFGIIDRAPSGTPFLALAFAIRIVEGFGAACCFTANFAIIAAEFPADVAATFATFETAYGIGLIVGPVLGGALFELGGYTLPFVVVGALLLGCAACAIIILPPPDRKEDKGGGNAVKFWAHPATILPSLTMATTSACLGYLFAVLEPHVRQFELTPVLLGVVFVSNGAVYAVAAPISGYLCDKKVNPKLMWITGCVLTCPFLLFVGPAPFFPIPTYLWLVITSLVVFGLANSCIYVACLVSVLQDTVNRRNFPDNIVTYGLVSSVFSTSYSLGVFAGTSVGGYLLDTVGFRWGTMVFLGVEALVLVSSVIFYMLYEKRPTTGKDESVSTANGENARSAVMEKNPVICLSVQRNMCNDT